MLTAIARVWEFDVGFRENVSVAGLADMRR